MVEISGSVPLSLLDLLVEDNPPALARSTNVSLMKAFRESIRRNVEVVLNARRCVRWPSDLFELERSLIGYGLEDHSLEDVAGGEFSARFAAAIQSAVLHFEPRIKSLSVEFIETEDDLTLTFRLVAVVEVGRGDRERMTLNSTFDAVRPTVAVKRS